MTETKRYVAKGKGILQHHQLIDEFENVVGEDGVMQELKESPFGQILKFAQNLVASSLNQLTSVIQDILLKVRPLPDSKANNHNGGGGGGGRKLHSDDDPFPYWIKSKDRKLLQSNGNGNENGNGVPVADVVVVAYGSGNFSKVMDAISVAPEYSGRRYVIYVKKGVYNEYVEISKKKWNFMMIGDGIDITVISDNRSFIDSWTTYRSEQDDLIGSFNPLNQATAVPNHNSQLGWQPAFHNKVKFNCDAAFCKSSSSAALAVILRDSKGNLLTSCAHSCKASSAAQAEAHSVRLACLIAKA
ncbi:putative pectinesterase/pectinesterase inhibitor 44 [Camellia lanceoleosa]|uniref:Pectinesterase/pectinesterase inhibitor 44 n=1 Tax=Camellia lanceoleosa TaxID=1840588 RepID=A0ACC0I4S2_9ERIC|nr:putative pectinesterase/pectinesterase inhibitor 44 [Camellia lanceoleosa]